MTDYMDSRQMRDCVKSQDCMSIVSSRAIPAGRESVAISLVGNCFGKKRPSGRALRTGPRNDTLEDFSQSLNAFGNDIRRRSTERGFGVLFLLIQKPTSKQQKFCY